jgi:protein involved in polysaccharide export with SLBB domain
MVPRVCTKPVSRQPSMKSMPQAALRNFPTCVFFAVFAFGGMALSQTAEPSERAVNNPVAGNKERAARLADLVSLSPSAITQLLQREPGLLLEVKKALVRKAYEEGRLLNPEDLTDDALFQQLHDDPGVRSLATREIEARMYVRAKPNADELHQDPDWAIVDKGSFQARSSAEPAATGSQEGQYWATHEQIPLNHESTGAVSREEEEEVPSESPKSRPVPRPYPLQDFHAQPSLTANGTSDWFLPPESVASAASQPASSGIVNASLNQPVDPAAVNLGMPRSGTQFIMPSPMTQTPLSPTAPTNISAAENAYRVASASPSVTQRPATFEHDPDPSRAGIRRQPNPYQDVPSLYDLYKQFSKRSPVLQRFGMDVFQNGSGNADQLPMDVPVGPDYVLGPGDGLNIAIWGSASGHLQRVVDRQGIVNLPEAGNVQVTGKTIAEVQQSVENTLRTQYRDAKADVSLTRLRTVRVYVVGDVTRPGAYDVSALSTPLNALYSAGGPTTRGSLRLVRHFRGTQLLETVDLYDLLLHGVRNPGARLEPGDTIQVPPPGKEVTVEGVVRRPAIYELNGESKLAEILDLAGGVLTSGTLRHIEVERIVAHESRTMLRLDLPEENGRGESDRALSEFEVRDGDKVRISPILPFSDKTVFLDGHVFHPGKYAYHEGMQLRDLVSTYNELLPEPARHAELIRLSSPDYAPSVLAFDLADVMGAKANLELKPFDTVRIFSRFDFEEPPVITLSGEVRHPGDHLTNGRTRLCDAIYLAGGATPDALVSEVQLFRRTSDGALHVFTVDLGKALRGDEHENIQLEPMDRIFVHKNLSKADPPSVRVEGQVQQPGRYPLGESMTASQLVRLAGGLPRGAYAETADLTRYGVRQDNKIPGEHSTIALSRAMIGDRDADARLHDGDVLSIREVTGWHDVGATIVLKGEVAHPGTYGIQEGERLSSVMERAGGFRTDAYAYGVIFERVQVRELERANREQLVRQVQMDGSDLALIPEGDADQKMAKDAALNQWHAAMEKLQNSPPSGRLAIRISRDIRRWANTSADVEMRAGDVVYVPKRPNFVMVDGAVYNPTAVAYKPGKSAAWYLDQAGGPTNMANKKAMFVIRADGFVAGGSGTIFGGGALHTPLEPGDLIMVPEKAYSGTTKWKSTLQSAQLAYAVGVAIQVARSF